MLATVTPGVQWRCHTVRGPWCYRRSWKAVADPFSFRCTQHVGPIMPWVLAWATWHHSAQPLCNSTFSSDIQGNKKRIRGWRERGGKKRWNKSLGGRRGRSSPGAERTRKLSLVHTNLTTHYLRPMYSLREQRTPGQAHPSITVIRCTNECQRAQGQWLSWFACW